MPPTSLMGAEVTITRTTAVTWDVDALGRPQRLATEVVPVKTRGRLVRAASPQFNPGTDGAIAALWRLYVPYGTGLRDSDRITIDGVDYEPVDAADTVCSPLTGQGYETVTVRAVSEAT